VTFLLHSLCHRTNGNMLPMFVVYSAFNRLKGARSRFPRLEKFNLNFSSTSFVIRVNLLHP